MVESAKRASVRLRTILVAAVLAIVAVVLIVFGVRYVLGPSVTVEDLVSNQPGLGETKDVTKDYCANEVGCTEAWSTKYGVYMKFGSKAEAAHWGTIFGGDGARWGEFVLDTRDHDLSSDQRVTAVQILLAYDGV